MTEREIDIADMQCWVFRIAQTRWHISPIECAELFKKYDTALRQSRYPTVAQTAAKRFIRTDLPFAWQPKKKYRIFCGLGMRNGNKPIDCLLWYPRGKFYFYHKLYLRPYHFVIFSLTFFGTSIKPNR